MTGRSVPEWVGATPDTAVPPRVRLRVFERANGRCVECSRRLYPHDEWQADHVQALANGGENRETNLQLLCGWCHKAKTAADTAAKAKTYAKRSKHTGAQKKRSSFPCSKDSRFKAKVGGGVVDRRTGEPIGRKAERTDG